MTWPQVDGERCPPGIENVVVLPVMVQHHRGGGATAQHIEAANACLATGDNACVVQALEGKAKSAPEMEMLIETYRAMGDTSQAYRNMAVYVQRFPTARRAEAYRQMLERQGQ